MPTRMKFVCHQVACSLKTQNGRQVPTTTITFNVVPNDPVNHWFRTGANDGGNRSIAITTTDPVASVAFQVGRNYTFSIEESVDELVAAVDAVDAADVVDPHLNAAQRRRARRAANPLGADHVVDADERRLLLAIERDNQARDIQLAYAMHYMSIEEATEQLNNLGVHFLVGETGIILV